MGVESESSIVWGYTMTKLQNPIYESHWRPFIEGMFNLLKQNYFSEIALKVKSTRDTSITCDFSVKKNHMSEFLQSLTGEPGGTLELLKDKSNLVSIARIYLYHVKKLYKSTLTVGTPLWKYETSKNLWLFNVLLLAKVYNTPTWIPVIIDMDFTDVEDPKIYIKPPSIIDMLYEMTTASRLKLNSLFRETPIYAAVSRGELDVMTKIPAYEEDALLFYLPDSVYRWKGIEFLWI